MRRFHIVRVGVTAALLASFVGYGASAGKASADQGDCPSGQPPYRAERVPRRMPRHCNLVGKVIIDRGIALVVPPEGTGVGGEELYPDHVNQFTIETGHDGTVTLGHVDSGDESVLDFGGGSHPNPCYDDAGSMWGQESHVHRWFYNWSTTPSYLSASTTLEELRDAVYNITHVNTDCTNGWGNSATGAQAEYSGNTSLRAEMTSSGACDGFNDRDGVNTRDFGDTGSSLARACWWYYLVSNELAEADFRLNKADYTWTLTPGTGCSSAYDVEGVATHEWGHVFGMNHATPESDHGLLTMSPNNEGPCQRSERTTLGRGDWLQIINTYGSR